MQAAIAEAPIRLGGLSQNIAQNGIVRSAVPISHWRPIDPDQGTRPTLAHFVALFAMSDGLSPGGIDML